MAAKKKTPAKKPAPKKKSAPARKATANKASAKKTAAKKSAPAKKSAAKKSGAKKTAAKRRPARTSKRPSASRKVAAKKLKVARAPKPKLNLPEAPEALALARSIAEVAHEKKAENVVIIDTRARSSAVGYDYIVLASGESDRQLSAIHEGVDEILKPQNKRPAAVEASADWVCVTYDEGVVAHFFTPDRRELMDLEDLWKDAPRVS